jgi:GntR family transcriptional regulator
MIDRKGEKGAVLPDRYSSIPLFLQIAETLKRRISLGEYSERKMSFTGEELEKEFETSSITIRKALDVLRSEGIVERRRGIGTILSEIISEPIIFELHGSLKKMIKILEKLKPQIQIIEIATIECPKRAQNILLLNPDQKVWRMKRIRKYKGTPVALHTYYADPNSCEGITNDDLQKTTFSNAFQRVSGLKIDMIQQSIMAAIADLDISTVLKTPFGAPVFFNENIYHSPSGEVLLFSQSYFRGDMYVFNASVQL